MAQYIGFHKVMDDINGEDSDWCDSDDDLVPNVLDGGIDSFISSRHHQAEDPLDRIEHCQEDTILEEAEESKVQPVSSPLSNESATVLLSASESFMLVPGPRRSVLIDVDEDSKPDDICKIWGEDTFATIADQTNLYAAQKTQQSGRMSVTRNCSPL